MEVKILNIEETIVYKLRNVNDHEKTLIVNGRYFLFEQKSVYVTLVADKFVRFFTRVKADFGNAVVKEDVTAKVLNKLQGISTSPVLGSYTHNENVPNELCNVMVDGTLNFLIVESPLYYIARNAIKDNRVRIRLQNEYISMHETQVNQLIMAFKQLSFDNYYRFMYSKSQRRIINRCYKKKPFFNVLHAFIPVAIEYSYIYNPLLDDPSNDFFAHSKLMQMAVEKNRCVEINSDLRCYMLTHEEICIALGLTKFMKFTPEFLYKLIVSLLRPDLASFPSKTRKIYVRKATDELVEGFKTVYTESAYDEKLAELATQIENIKTEEERQAIQKKLAILNEYSNIDALYYEIEKDRRALVNIGAATFDNKVSTDTLYNILLEAQLRGGDT